MALISYYPLNGDGKDILGNGPTNSVNCVTFEGEVVGGGGAIYLSLLPMTGDYTISADIYRIKYTADWCVDFSNGLASWGTGSNISDGEFIIQYSPNYGYPYLYISTKANRSNRTILFDNTEETIGVWYHAEIHRLNNTLQFYFNGELKFEYTHDVIPELDHVYFFNAGEEQTGGEYVKNVKLYDTAYTESAITICGNLYENNGNVYGIHKNE